MVGAVGHWNLVGISGKRTIVGRGFHGCWNRYHLAVVGRAVEYCNLQGTIVAQSCERSGDGSRVRALEG